MFSEQEKKALAKAMATAKKRMAFIETSEFTTAEPYNGIPIPDAATLKDGTLVMLNRSPLSRIGGGAVSIVWCYHKGKRRLVGLEYRGQIIRLIR